MRVHELLVKKAGAKLGIPVIPASGCHYTRHERTAALPLLRSMWPRRSSALNRYCQAHDISNLFVADAGPFVSNSDKNPTLTIIALASRTAEYLAEEMRKGNV